MLYAGNLGEKQGLEVVLQAAALTRQNPSIRYLMAGEGAARARLMLLAQSLGLDNLIFLPLQSTSRFPLLLAAADLHLVVQRQKAADLVMPSKLTNILAAGRPFIATTTAGDGIGPGHDRVPGGTDGAAGRCRLPGPSGSEAGRRPNPQEADVGPGPEICRGLLGPGAHLEAMGRFAPGLG